MINAHDPDAADALMSPCHRQNAPVIARGPKGFKAFFRERVRNSRGMRAEVVAVINTGPVEVSATDIRFDAPPPDWPEHHRITEVFRTDGHRLTEHWDIMCQPGASVPSRTGQSGASTSRRFFRTAAQKSGRDRAGLKKFVRFTDLHFGKSRRVYGDWFLVFHPRSHGAAREEF